MRLSLREDDDRCPAGVPVALVDLDTNELVAAHTTILEAARHKALLESGEARARDFEDDPVDDGDDVDDLPDWMVEPDDPDEDADARFMRQVF